MVKIIGANATLSIDSTAVGQIRNLQPPGGTRYAIETTCFDSTREEYVAATTYNPGILRFEQAWEPGDTGHEELDTAFKSGATVACQIVYDLATDKTDAFSGIITELGHPSVDAKGVISRQVSIQLTTAITRT